MKRRSARELFEAIATWADRHSPQTLFARALIIIVVPMLLLQALSAWWFYSQRGDNVTNRLALLAVRDLRALIALHDQFPDSEHRAWIVDHARTDIVTALATALADERPCPTMQSPLRPTSGAPPYSE